MPDDLVADSHCMTPKYLRHEVEQSLRNFGVRGPAKYLLRLRAKDKNSGNADVPYDLMTELLPYQGRGEFEPNDQRADATPFEEDSIDGLIAPATLLANDSRGPANEGTQTLTITAVSPSSSRGRIRSSSMR